MSKDTHCSCWRLAVQLLSCCEQRRHYGRGEKNKDQCRQINFEQKIIAVSAFQARNQATLHPEYLTPYNSNEGCARINPTPANAMPVTAYVPGAKLLLAGCMLFVSVTTAMKVTNSASPGLNFKIASDFDGVNAELYQGVQDSRRKIKCRDSDVIIVTYPKARKFVHCATDVAWLSQCFVICFHRAARTG